jgi:hypothetical protein
VGYNATVARDLYGRWYLSLIGADVGKSLTFVSGSLTANWAVDPSPDGLESFLTGWSASFGFGFGFGIQTTVNFSGASLGVGLFSPQVGGSLNYCCQFINP